ncbi:hypothetical protein FRC07_000566 [Ceratobasidium sp. 392]|nr:hypothetical protein FRC07_000566 [Ceratobasidium sp. 392]
MTYGELSRGLHHDPMLDLHRLSIDSSTETYCYYFDSPIIVPTPSMNDLDYFPHRVLVLRTKRISCLRSRTDPTCGRGPGYDCTHSACTTPITRSSTPRGPTSASVQRSNARIPIRDQNPCIAVAAQNITTIIQKSSARARLPTFIHPALSPRRRCATARRLTLEAGAPLPPVSARVGPLFLCLGNFLPDPDALDRSSGLPPDPANHYNVRLELARNHARGLNHGHSGERDHHFARLAHSNPFRISNDQPPTAVVPGEGTLMARDLMAGIEDDVEDADIRTEIGSPEMGMEAPEEELRLPPICTLPPLPSYGPGPEIMSFAEQTRLAMRGGGAGISRDVLLYGPAGVTPAPAELARNNVRDKLPPIPSHVPPRQATFFGVQNMPVADGSRRFATICAPLRGGIPVPVSSRPVYPPAGIAPLIAGHLGLPHGGLTAPIERGDEVTEWKDQQRAKERANVVVKDGAEDVPKARSPTQATRRLPDERLSTDDTGSSTTSTSCTTQNAGSVYWPPTPSSMPSSPESPKTRRERQRASMRKEVLGEQVAKQIKESDPSREPPARTLIWFVTEVLRRSRTSINVLQVASAYLAGAKPEIHNQLRIAADRQAKLAIQIAGIPQHVRDALPGMDWLGSEFTPSPLIDPRRTFLASLVLASKFLLDKAFSNKAWAKLSGLEALEVGKCERALGTTLNWRLWVSREASRNSTAPAPSTHNYLSPAHSTITMSPPLVFARSRSGAWENPTLSSLRGNVSPARSSSPISTVFTQGSTPSLTLSKPGSKSDAPHGYDEFSAWTHTLEMVSEPEMLHGSPFGYPSATMGGPMHIASEPVVQTRPVLPPFRSFDRPVLRHGLPETVTPQTDSNLGCVHMPPVCYDRQSNKDPLAYTDFARPWETMNGQAHWDFEHGGISFILSLNFFFFYFMLSLLKVICVNEAYGIV